MTSWRDVERLALALPGATAFLKKRR